MKYPLTAATMVALFAGPALAGPDCSTMGEPQAIWPIVKAFEEAGGKVVNAKVSGGDCYEIYGFEGEKKVEIYYNPVTGEELEREES